jgi:hypothetical protein
MQLDLTDEEAVALVSLLNRAIDEDRYPLPPRVRTLRGIRAKFPTAPRGPPPARPPTPEERSPARARRSGRPQRMLGVDGQFVLWDIASRRRD